MDVLTKAADEVVSSQRIRLLMQYMLAAGNYLNSGTLATHRKNARGVKLNFVLEVRLRWDCRRHRFTAKRSGRCSVRDVRACG